MRREDGVDHGLLLRGLSRLLDFCFSHRGAHSQLKGYGGYKIFFPRPFAETQVSWGFHRFFPPVWLRGFVKKPEGALSEIVCFSLPGWIFVL